MTSFTNLRGQTTLINLDNVAFLEPHANNVNDCTEITFVGGATLAVKGSISFHAELLVPQTKVVETKITEPVVKPQSSSKSSAVSGDKSVVATTLKSE